MTSSFRQKGQRFQGHTRPEKFYNRRRIIAATALQRGVNIGF